MPSPLVLRIREAWQRLDHGQQISLSILAPCACLIMVMMVLSLHTSITMPFRAPRALLKQSDVLLAQQRALAAENDQNAANKDTDGDGLTDYDELHSFRTSPYLADSDSDTVPDGEEVRRGTDPNCPPQRDCYAYPGTDPDAVPRAQAPTSPTSTSVTAEAAAALEAPRPPNELTPPEIRQYLTRNHLATPQQVDALPDDAVIELYRRAYGDLQAAQNSAASAAASSAPIPASSASSSFSESSPLSTP